MQAPTATLETLREQHEALILRAETAKLEGIVRGLELSNRLVESEWGDLVDRREYLYDTPGWNRRYDYRITSPGDRARGKCTPFFENETDLANIRGIGRYLATAVEHGVTALESLINYTIGTGFTYKVATRDESETKKPLVAEVQRALEEILQGNSWTGDKETEAFYRAPRDGETILWAKDEGGFPLILLAEPDYLREPAQVRDLEDWLGEDGGGYDWSFGVATQSGRHDRPYGYFLQWEGSASDWDVAPASEVSHIKLNVDRMVKRGISDFYAAYLTLERAAKLLGNTLQGAAIQATIAYIKEAAAGTPSDAITTARNTRATHSQTESTQRGTTRTVYGEKFYPGRVIDASNVKYHAGPLGQSQAPVYETIVQLALRVVGARWSMPEYMISGDASNANYSSTLVSGGPFDRATQRRQAFYKRHFEDVIWKCLAVYVRRGRFMSLGIGTLSDLKREVQLKIDAPPAAIQDKVQEEEIRDKQQAAGILSKKTRSALSDLDYDIEQANIREQAPAPADVVAAAMESLRTTEEARALLEALYP